MQQTEKDGLGPACREALAYGVDMNQIDYLLGLTPYARLMRHEQALQLVRAVRKAGIRFYGFDPRSARSSDPA